MYMTFRYTWEKLYQGKSVTRRVWKPRYFESWQKQFDEYGSSKFHDVYDKSPRNGGKKIGLMRLTERPYLERLGDMPKEDLIWESVSRECPSVQAFADKYFEGNLDLEVAVVRFQFYPTEQKQKTTVMEVDINKLNNAPAIGSVSFDEMSPGFYRFRRMIVNITKTEFDKIKKAIAEFFYDRYRFERCCADSGVHRYVLGETHYLLLFKGLENEKVFVKVTPASFLNGLKKIEDVRGYYEDFAKTTGSKLLYVTPELFVQEEV